MCSFLVKYNWEHKYEYLPYPQCSNLNPAGAALDYAVKKNNILGALINVQYVYGVSIVEDTFKIIKNDNLENHPIYSKYQAVLESKTMKLLPFLESQVFTEDE